MLIVSHVVAGAVIAKTVPNLLFALPIAFASHFLLDMIPHAQAPTDEGYRPNRKTYIFVAADIVVVMAFLIYLKPSAAVLGVIFASILPDILDLTRYNQLFYKIFRPYFDFHDKVQKETNNPIGFITQIVLIGVSILVLLKWS